MKAENERVRATGRSPQRDTELGPLPEAWRVVRLGEVFDIQQGKSLSPKSRTGPRMRPFLRTANVYWGYIDLTSVDEMHFDELEEQRLALRPGDLLVCEGGDIGRTALWEGQLPLCLYQNHLHRLRSPREDVFPLFYMYWMQAAWTLLALYGGSGNKTTIPNLSQSRLAAFPIPLPPLAEQRAIAHVLRTVQRAKEASERVVAALKELKKSLMRHLFTYGPVPVSVGAQRAVPLQDTELGPLPVHWQVVRLGEVAEIRYGKAKPESFGTVPVIGSGGIYGWTDKPLIDFPSLVVGRKGTAGQVWLTEEPCWPSDTTFYLRWKQEVDVRFVHGYFLVNPLSGEHAKTTLPSLQRPDVENYPIPLPPLAEQHEIARILRAVDRRIEAEEAYRCAAQELFRSLLHELMSGRRRVPAEWRVSFESESKI